MCGVLSHNTFNGNVSVFLLVLTYFITINALQLKYIILVNRQGKVRLSRFYDSCTLKERQLLLKEVPALVLARKARQCNFIQFKGNACLKVEKFINAMLLCVRF